MFQIQKKHSLRISQRNSFTLYLEERNLNTEISLIRFKYRTNPMLILNEIENVKPLLLA